MLIQDGPSYLRLEAAEQIPADSQTVGDTRFRVVVCMTDHDTSLTVAASPHVWPVKAAEAPAALHIIFIGRRPIPF